MDERVLRRIDQGKKDRIVTSDGTRNNMKVLIKRLNPNLLSVRHFRFHSWIPFELNVRQNGSFLGLREKR